MFIHLTKVLGFLEIDVYLNKPLEKVSKCIYYTWWILMPCDRKSLFAIHQFEVVKTKFPTFLSLRYVKMETPAPIFPCHRWAASTHSVDYTNLGEKSLNLFVKVFFFFPKLSGFIINKCILSWEIITRMINWTKATKSILKCN